MSRTIWLIFAAALALAGCDAVSKEEAQYDDTRNPLIKQAQEDLDKHDPAKAAQAYEAAIAANPKLVEARYLLGHVYADKLNDPVGAIFYFQQYVKIAPSGPKVAEVKVLIDQQSQTFAASLPNAPAPTDTTKLLTENSLLKKQVEDAARSIDALQTQLKAREAASVAGAPTITPAPAENPAPGVMATDPTTTATPAPGATNGAPMDASSFLATATAPPPVSPPGPSRSYTVVKGDSFWKIAHKMYPKDTQNGVIKIQDANKHLLGKPLKIGQVLVIPE